MGTEKRERQRANRQLKYQQEIKEEQRRRTTRRGIIGAAAVAGGVALVVVIAWIGGAFSGDDGDETTPSTLPADVTASPTGSATPDTVVPGETLPNGFALGTGECAPDDVAEPVREFSAAPQLCIDPAASYTATFATDRGDVVVELDTAQTPGTVNNFVTLARYGYYDDTLIFRADPSIDIIQGGGRSNSDSPGYTIPDEGSGYTYEPGQLVMARTQAPDSSGGQWFFVTGPNAAALDGDGTYVVFGTVTEGVEITQEILALAGGDDGQTPTEDVVLESVTITEN